MAEETKKTVDSEEEIKASEEEKTTREETAEETEKQAEHAEETETEEENVSEKKGFFGKKKKDKKDTQIEDLTDKLRRQMAEFDNFRKRTEKEKSGMFEMVQKAWLRNCFRWLTTSSAALHLFPKIRRKTPSWPVWIRFTNSCSPYSMSWE